MSSVGKRAPTVAIGGINAQNIQLVKFKSEASPRRLDGVAVVSAIIAAPDPKIAAQELRSLGAKPPSYVGRQSRQQGGLNDLLGHVNAVIREIGVKKPLCHNMTNLVVQNFAANVALAM